MFKDIIKRLSESTKLFVSSMKENIRTRQLYAVVCMLCILFMLLFISVSNSEAKPMEVRANCDLVPQEQTYTEESKTIIVASVLAETDAGITAELNEMLAEPEPEVEERPNTLYYAEDNGYLFYLDAEYQDYLWQKLDEYNHTEFYEICLAIAYHESKFALDTVSATNDHGLMQINGGNYNWLHGKLGIDSLDDPYDNIDCGVYLFVSNYEKYGDIEAACTAYHQGSVIGSETSTRYSRCIVQHDLGCLKPLPDEDI